MKAHARIIQSIIIACAWTSLNAAKPAHVDDACYLAYARQIANHPLDPYGFEVFWYDQPEPANHVFVPPVLPYWLALGIHLFGNSVAILKLWLFPLVLLFVMAVNGIADLLAPVRGRCMAALVVFSPAFLPSLNLMLDIPALGLGLSAILLVLRQRDRARTYHYLQAGIVAALAMQTKYSMLIVPALLCLYGLLSGKLWSGIVGASAACGIFLAWEMTVVGWYGESHFWYAVTHPVAPSISKLTLLSSLPGHLGALCMFSIAFVRPRTRAFASVCAALVLLSLSGYLCLIVLPDGFPGSMRPLGLFRVRFSLADGLFKCAGIGLILVVLFGLIRELQSDPRESVARCIEARFILGWLVIELVAYLMLSPFPAARRVLSLAILLAIVLARQPQSLGGKAEASLRWLTSVQSVLLAALIWHADWCEADSQARAAQAIAAKEAGHPIWFVGHWGFQEACQRYGMTPYAEGAASPPEGSRFVIPQTRITQQRHQTLLPRLKLDWIWEYEDSNPLQTLPWYYAGSSPLRACQSHRLRVEVYIVKSPDKN